MTRTEDYTTLSAGELEALVARCEGALFAGTSSHGDVVTLIDAEAELGRREREAFKRFQRTEGLLKTSRTGTGDNGALTF